MKMAAKRLRTGLVTNLTKGLEAGLAATLALGATVAVDLSLPKRKLRAARGSNFTVVTDVAVLLA